MVNSIASSRIHVMHIIDKLSVSGSGIHGPTKTIERSIPYFDSEKFRFSICSLRTPEEAGEIFKKKGIPITFLSKGKFDPSTIFSLLSLIKRERPDILHLHGYGSTTFGRVVSLITGLPNIVHERAVLPNQPIYQTLADTILAPFTTKAIAVSEAVREFMITTRKENPDKVETIIIGIPLFEHREINEAVVNQKRHELHIPQNDCVVSCVGRLDTQKGQIYFLEAAKEILKTFPNTTFLLVGNGPDFSKLQTFAIQNSIQEKVVFAGFRQDITHLLKMSDIFCLPSLWEGFPNALIEAMNCRLPVVASPAEGSRDVVHDGENGFLVPFKDSQAIVEKVNWLLDHPQQAKIMGKYAWQEAQKYDIASSTKRFSEIYAELTTRKLSYPHI